MRTPLISENNPHYDASGRALVPPAERAFLPESERETAQETVWFNPTDKDVFLDLYIGVTPCRSEAAKRQFRSMSPLQKKEFRTGYRRFIIRAGDRRAIHTDFDQGIQQTSCQEPECTSRRMYCKDATHHKMVTGGLGPQLINERMQFRPTVDPSLVEAAALEEAATLRAKEFLQQKEVAEKSMLVAFSEAERARNMRAAQDEAEKNAEAKANAQAANPGASPKKDK